MDRHRFDPVSFIVGLVFTLAAVIVLAEGRLIDEGRVLLPLGLIALGFAFLLRLAPGGPDAPPSGEPATPGEPGPNEPTRTSEPGPSEPAGTSGPATVGERAPSEAAPAEPADTSEPGVPLVQEEPESRS